MLHKANVSSRYNQYNSIKMDFNGAKSGSGRCLVVANHFGVFLEKLHISIHSSARRSDRDHSFRK